MVALFSAIFVYDYIPAPNIYAEGVVNFWMYKPYVYRVLIPLLARGVMLLGVPHNWALAGVVFTSGLASFGALKLFYSSYIAKNRLWAFSLMSWLLMFTLMQNHKKHYDFATIFFFCLSLYLMVKIAAFNAMPVRMPIISNRHAALLFALFPIMVLNRETTALLILVYAIYFWGTDFKVYLIHITYMTTTFLLVYFVIIQNVFRDWAGDSIHVLRHLTMETYLQTPAMIFAVFIIIGCAMIIFTHWNDGTYSRFIKSALILVPIQIALHLLFGYPFEFRVLIESFPVFFVSVIIGLTSTNRVFPKHTYRSIDI